MPLINIYVKLAMTLALSALSIILFCVFKGKAKKKCMIAMILSTCGDLFMTNIIGIPEEYELVNTAVGAAFFIAAHLIYADCFRGQIKEKGYNIFNGGLIFGISIMILSWAILTALMCDMTDFKALMFPLVTIYIIIIGINLSINFSYSFSAKGINYLNAVGIFIFYFSDIFIFLDMWCDYTLLHNYVWYVYPIGQLLLLLFNSPLKKQPAPAAK